MALNGIDVASYQATLNLDNISYDFVTIKATEGTSYVNPDCDRKYQAAKAAGKLRGVYMFVDHGGNPEAEADYFVDNVDGYVGDAILAVDWEGAFVEDVDYLHRILTRVYVRTGVKPLVYMSEYVENTYDWSGVVADDFGLWIARYADYELDHDYDTSGAGKSPVLKYWSFAAMWQWTSSGVLSGYAGNLDCDIFYGDANVWQLYAAVPAPAAPAPAPSKPVDVEVKPNDNDGSVVVSTPPSSSGVTPTPVERPEEPEALASAATPTVPAKGTAKVKGVRTGLQTVVGGVITYSAVLVADPHFQTLLSAGVSRYVAPALLGLGISSGLVSFIVNLLEDRVTGKAA